MALIIIQNGLISPLKNKNHFTGFLHTLSGSYPIIPDSRSICLIPQRCILQLIHAAWFLGKVSNALQYILGTNYWDFSIAEWYLFVHTSYLDPPLCQEGTTPTTSVPPALYPIGPWCHLRTILPQCSREHSL